MESGETQGRSSRTPDTGHHIAEGAREMDLRTIARDADTATTSDLEPAYQEACDQLWDAYERFERLTLRFAAALWCAPRQRRAIEESLYDGADALRRVQETLARTRDADLTALPQPVPTAPRTASSRVDLPLAAAS